MSAQVARNVLIQTSCRRYYLRVRVILVLLDVLISGVLKTSTIVEFDDHPCFDDFGR